MSKVTLEQLGLGADDLAAIGKLSESGMTPDQIADAIKKIHDMNSSASEIDSVSNVIDRVLAPTHKLFRESVNRVKNDTILTIVGDSILNNYYNKLPEYLEHQLSKINIGFFNNAYSGQSSYNWQRNIGGSTIQQLIDNVNPDGENTIIYFNFGVNDYSLSTTESASYLNDAIVLLKTSLPKAQIILQQPIASGSTTRDTYLQNAYETMAQTHGLFLVDTFTAMDYTIHSDSDYYFDATHPNEMGSRRLINYMLDRILPIELLSIVDIEQAENTLANPNLNPVIDTTNGFYYISSDLAILGTPTDSAKWRRLLPIPVEPNFTIRVVHQGNKNDHVFMNESGWGISNIRPATIVNFERFVTVPAGAYEMRINLSDQGTTYDALNDTPIVEYYSSSSNQWLSIEKINNGLDIRNIINKFKNGILVDDYGLTGLVGQTLTIDANSKMKWA